MVSVVATIGDGENAELKGKTDRMSDKGEKNKAGKAGLLGRKGKKINKIFILKQKGKKESMRRFQLFSMPPQFLLGMLDHT